MHSSTTTTTPGSTSSLVNELFRRMRAIKPGWRAAFQSQEELNTAKQEWLLAITEAGIRDWSVIESALGELRQQPGPFIPSTGDFIALCRKAQLSHWRLPSEPEAWAMLNRFFGPRHVRRNFSQLNPAVYAAWKFMDWAVVSDMQTKDQRKAFREAWARVMDDVQHGRPLPKAEAPPPEEALENIPPQRCRTESAERQMASIKSLVADL